MALRESFLSDLKNVHGDRVFVMRRRGHDALAPSAKLLADFKGREAELKSKLGGVAAHNQAWDDVDYEARFTAQFFNDPKAVEELRAIAAAAAERDVFLICFEKPPKKCHRFLLLDFAKRLPPP
jgi:hypothetical protein